MKMKAQCLSCFRVATSPTIFPVLHCLIAVAVLFFHGSPLSASEGEDQDARARLVIADFSDASGLAGWEVEDDVVMGGRSRGAFEKGNGGFAVFSGDVSLENDGGFSSVQHYFDPLDVSSYTSAVLRLKGDGKKYQFLVESDRSEGHYYVYEFETGGDWETVTVPLAEMYPMYRGDRLTIPNYPGQTLAMARLLIANKLAETFRLEIEKIWLE